MDPVDPAAEQDRREGVAELVHRRDHQPGGGPQRAEDTAGERHGRPAEQGHLVGRRRRCGGERHQVEPHHRLILSTTVGLRNLGRAGIAGCNCHPTERCAFLLR
jgi:hypothetical protein